jgi:pimeloyl-ACP methyl ester carboxylesterase
VKVDPSADTSPNTYIGVVRRPATGGDPKGVIITSPSGAGSSSAVHVAGDLFPSVLLEQYDLVSVQWRGTGEDAVRCDGAAALLNADPTSEDDAASGELGGLADDVAESCDHNPVLPQTGVATAAADLEAVRQALHTETLSFLMLGDSSLIALAYVGMHPDNVDRMVFDSPLIAGGSLEQLISQQAEAAEASLQQGFRLCLVLGCPSPEPAALYLRTITALEEEPVTAEGVSVGPAELAAAARQAAVAYDLQAPLHLVEAMVTLEEGDPRPLADLSAGATDPGALGAHLASVCRRWPHGESVDFSEAAEAVAETSPLVGPAMVALHQPCATWSSETEPPVDPEGTFSGRVLVLATTADPVAPTVHSERVADLFGDGAHLLSVDAFGHLTIGRSACAMAAVGALLSGAHTALPDTCPTGSDPPS